MKKILYLVPFVVLLLTGCDVRIEPAEAKAVMEDALVKEEAVDDFTLHLDSYQRMSLTMIMDSSESESSTYSVTSEMNAEADLTMLDQLGLDDEQSISYVQTVSGEASVVSGEETSNEVLAEETFAYYLKDSVMYLDYSDAPEQYAEEIGGSGVDLKIKKNYDAQESFMDLDLISPMDLIDQILEEYDFLVERNVLTATENAGKTTVSVEIDTQIFGEMNDIYDAEDNSEPIPTSFPDYSDGYVVTDGEQTETTVINKYKILLSFDENHYLTRALHDYDIEITEEGSEFINGTTNMEYRSDIQRSRINDETLVVTYPTDLDSYAESMA